MKKFRFQLETLLKVTRMKKEEAEVAFAEAVRRLDEARLPAPAPGGDGAGAARLRGTLEGGHSHQDRPPHEF